MRRVQLELRACKDKLAEIPQDFFDNLLDLKLKHKLYNSAANAARLYGLPKIHKENIPLQPIYSSINVPRYSLSKHIGSFFKCATSKDYNIKNSIELKNRLKKIELEEDDTLISLDVVSLFTNIPIYLAIKTEKVCPSTEIY